MHRRERYLSADVLRRAMVGRDGWRVVRAPIECGAVVVIERRNGEQYACSSRMDPREVDEAVALALDIASSSRLVIRPVRDLKVVLAQRAHDPQLVRSEERRVGQESRAGWV